MKALTLTPADKSLHIEDRPEPKIESPNQVMLKVLEVGICGTDREEAEGQRGTPPPGKQSLVIGHEMLGEVVAVGESVTKVKKGDLAVFSVRRGCNACPACNNNRFDMCYTGNYRERGIKDEDGYQQQFVVDEEAYIIPINQDMRPFAVLSEPMSVVEKAIDLLITLQRARLPDWEQKGTDLSGRKALIAGLGPIGLLAAIIFRLRGAEVYGMDVVDDNSLRPTLFKKLGGTYIDGRKTDLSTFQKKCSRLDLILEAAGVPTLDFHLLEALGINGAYVLTGVAADHKSVTIDGGTLMERLVMNNQVMVGSVNAAPYHWDMGAKDLEEAGKRWGDVLSSLITQRLPVDHYKEAMESHASDEIKSVLTWDGQG